VGEWLWRGNAILGASSAVCGGDQTQDDSGVGVGEHDF
jgi:hypothetical protein